MFHSVQAAEEDSGQLHPDGAEHGRPLQRATQGQRDHSLANALAKIERYTFPVELNDVSRPFFAQTAKVEMPSLAAAMTAIVANPNDTVAANTISKDPRYASMLRTSCVATRLAAGHADNALPQTATANVNCRVAPHVECRPGQGCARPHHRRFHRQDHHAGATHAKTRVANRVRSIRRCWRRPPR